MSDDISLQETINEIEEILDVNFVSSKEKQIMKLQSKIGFLNHSLKIKEAEYKRLKKLTNEVDIFVRETSSSEETRQYNRFKFKVDAYDSFVRACSELTSGQRNSLFKIIGYNPDENRYFNNGNQ